MRLGKKFTLQSLKRIMFVYFCIVYSVPFFIDTTYMSAKERFNPFLNTLKQIQDRGDKGEFTRTATMFLRD